MTPREIGVFFNEEAKEMTDYDFIKRLLKMIDENNNFCVDIQLIKEKLARIYPDMDTDKFNNVFFKSLFLLKDCGAIEEMAGRNLGFRIDVLNNIQYTDCVIRLTSVGYNFYENMCKNGFMSKIKNISLVAAIEFSKAFIAKSVDTLL